MVKLHKLLSDKQKIRRRRRIVLSLNITTISWITECVGSIAMVFLIHYSKDAWMKRILQYCIASIYSIIVPCTYLMKSSDFRKRIVDNPIYIAMTNRLFPHINQIRPINHNNNEVEQNDSS